MISPSIGYPWLHNLSFGVYSFFLEFATVETLYLWFRVDFVLAV